MKKKSTKTFNTSDLSTKRRKKKRARTGLVTFAVLLLLVGSIALLRSSVFRINNVEITGVKNISTDKIKEIINEKLAGNFFFIIPKNNALFYPKEQISSVLVSEFPRLDSVDVKTGFNGTLYIEVQEKVLNALWCDMNSNCYAMDYSGFIFDKAPSNSQNSLVFSGLVQGDPTGKQFGDEGFVQSLAEFNKKLSVLGFQIYRINIINTELGEAYAQNGVVLKFAPSDIKDPELIEYLHAFIDNLKDKNVSTSTQFDYLDLRYGNKIFYKMK